MLNSPNVVVLIGYVQGAGSTNKRNDLIEKYKQMSEFYSCKNEYNYVSYVQNGTKEQLNYIDYSGNHEKSKGIFNQNGLLDKKEIKDLKRKLRETKSCIWHGVISFEKEFGQQYCSTNEQAMKLMQTKFPRLFTDIGCERKNVEWYAGLHENTDNYHIHFSFFEKAPTLYSSKNGRLIFRRGKIDMKYITKFKAEIELYLTGVTNKIIMVRKNLTSNYEEMLKNNKEKIFWLAKNLVMDLEKIPVSKMFYDSENLLEYKTRIDELITKIIVSNKNVNTDFNNFVDFIKEKEKVIDNIYKQNKSYYKNHDIGNKYLQDIYRRLGNILLKNLIRTKLELNNINFQTKNRLIKKRIQKSKREALARHINYLYQAVINEMYDAFYEYENKLKDINYKRLIEEGELNN